MLKTNSVYLSQNTVNLLKAQNKKEDSLKNTNTETSTVAMKGLNDNYTDPLTKWPIRGLAYSNEIGVAISEIAPTAGTLLWIPALMYFGADIYDKYKNDKTSYDPSAGRGTKQAVFQALASVILPTIAVKAGQNTISKMAKLSRTGISIDKRINLSENLLNFMETHKLKDYANNIDEYKEKFRNSITNQTKEMERDHSLSPVKRFIKYLQGKSANSSQIEKISKVANSKIDKIFEMRKILLEGKKPTNMSKKLFNIFNKTKEEFIQNPKYSKDFEDHAAKYVLKAYEKSKIFNNKLIKTLGGFIALALLAKPIDNFVENTVIHKILTPSFDKIKSIQSKKTKNSTPQNEIVNFS